MVNAVSDVSVLQPGATKPLCSSKPKAKERVAGAVKSGRS